MRETLRQTAGLAAAVVTIAALYALLFLDGDIVTWLLLEEHPIELLGALALLSCSVMCYQLWRQTRRDSGSPLLLSICYLALTALFFLGFAEEESWGQRLIGYGTPSDIAEVNAQDEFNFHNLEGLTGLLSPDRLFQVFWFVLGVVVPVLALWSRLRRLLVRMVPVFPLGLVVPFVFNQAMVRVTTNVIETRPSLYESQLPYQHAIFETKETVVSVLLAAGFWFVLRRQKQQPAATHAPSGSRISPRS